jgi:carboxylesterase
MAKPATRHGANPYPAPHLCATPEGVAVSVRPGAEAFEHDGDEIGILLCHGFTGNPSSLRPWAEYLAKAGHTVRVPRLPGHGTTWKEMNGTRWGDWYGEVDAAFAELRARSRIVVVGGLSMGGALALRLAQVHGGGENGVAGLVLVNPAVKLEDRRLALVPALRWVVPSFPPVGNDIKKPGVTEDAYDKVPPHALHSMLGFYRIVAADLPKVDQPILLLRSPEDHVVPASSSAVIREKVTSSDVTEVLCADSYHVATLDNDATKIMESSLAFVERLASGVGGGR